MTENLLFILKELGFWLFFILFVYSFIIRPKTNAKREEKFYTNIQSGDEIETYRGIVGKVAFVKGEKVTIITGSNDSRISLSLEQIKTNKDYKKRRKEYLNSLPLLKRIKEVL